MSYTGHVIWANECSRDIPKVFMWVFWSLPFTVGIFHLLVFSNSKISSHFLFSLHVDNLSRLLSFLRGTEIFCIIT